MLTSGMPYVQAAGAAAKTFSRIVSTLGIGTGRNEADRIVPSQNALGDLLVTANNAMGDATVSAEQLRQIRQAVFEEAEQFRAYIDNRQQFPDGRASAQARWDMFDGPAPDKGLARRTLENLDRTIGERSGIFASVTGAVSGGSGMLIAAGLGLGALFLLRE